MRNFLLLLLGVFLLLSCANEKPQEPDPVRRKSPIAITSVTHQPSQTYAKIVYGQPYKNGRNIFGDLVPYGEVWRTGANEATEMTITNPLIFNGRKVDAGTYSLLTIPERNEWTIILNDSLGQWGAFDYKPKYDRLRTTVTSKRAEQLAESFTIQFSKITGDSSSIVMRWDTTKVEIPISFIDDTVNIP